MRYFFALSFFLFACTQDIPDDILPPQKMQIVLWDVLKADEVVAWRQMRDSSSIRSNTRTSLYDTVFAIHHINKDVFKKSLDYYQTRPDLLKGILDSLQKKSEIRVALPEQ